MHKRPIGNSALAIAPLVLGGNVFGWTADEPVSFALLDGFVDAGGTMIDTADVYSAWVPGHSGGESESVIGRWLKTSGKRGKAMVATKVGFMAGLAPETIAAACDASLQRLGIDSIDLYYQHKDDESVPLADSLGASTRSNAPARSARSACRNSPPSGCTRPCASPQKKTWSRHVRCRPGTIWSSARNSKAPY